MNAELMLKKVDFLTFVAGRRIVDIDLALVDSMGNPAADGEVILRSITLDDGTVIDLTASGQVGYDDVWATVQKVA